MSGTDQWIALAIILAVVIVLIAYSLSSPRIPTRLERLRRSTDAEIKQAREHRDGDQS